MLCLTQRLAWIKAAQAPPLAARSGPPYGRAAWAPVPPAGPIGAALRPARSPHTHPQHGRQALDRESRGAGTGDPSAPASAFPRTSLSAEMAAHQIGVTRSLTIVGIRPVEVARPALGSVPNDTRSPREQHP